MQTKDRAIEPSGRQTSRLDALRACVARLRDSGDLAPGSCKEIEDRLDAGTFNLVAVGQFKRGKTTLINALIGENLLPVGAIPLTSVVTILAYGETLAVRVLYEDGREEQISRDRLPEYVTERGNPNNAKGVREVEVTYPSPWLKAGVRLVDTPGIGSVYEHNTDVALRFLPKADAVLFILSVEQPVSQAEREFLCQVAEHAAKVFVLLNKADLLAESELPESIEFARGAVSRALGGGAALLAISGRLAIEAQATGSQEILRRSGLPALSEALGCFLSREKEKALAASLSRKLSRLVSQARFGREVELKALATPLEELGRKLERFEARKKELLAARDEHAMLVKGESERLLRQRIEKDLEAFEAALARQLELSVERTFEAHRELPSKALQEALQRHAIEEVRRSYDAWRVAEGQVVEKELQAFCSRIAARIDSAIDELFRFSAELFAVPYEAIRAEAAWTSESGFSYKFWEEPASLYLLISSAILALPKVIGDRILLRRAREFAAEAVHRQSGRVRYDFAQRLEKSARAFQTRLSDTIDAALAGLEIALREGADTRREGETEAAKRHAWVRASLGRLGEARSQLDALVGEFSETRP